MNFAEAYTIVDQIFSKRWQKGIALVGETKDAWIFKSHVISGDPLSGGSVIVTKKRGTMRHLNVGHLEDRKIAYEAKIINDKKVKKMLEIKN